MLRGFRRGFLCLPRPFLRGELLLDLRADGIHVHLICGCSITEHLGCILPHGSIEDGDFYQQTAKRVFLGAAQVSGKQFPDGIAVFGLLDAVLTGND